MYFVVFASRFSASCVLKLSAPSGEAYEFTVMPAISTGLRQYLPPWKTFVEIYIICFVSLVGADVCLIDQEVDIGRILFVNDALKLSLARAGVTVLAEARVEVATNAVTDLYTGKSIKFAVLVNSKIKVKITFAMAA